MKLGVNLLFLKDERNRGTATYVRELLGEIEKQPGVELIIFRTEFYSGVTNRSPRLDQRVCRMAGTGRFGRVMYEQFVLPYLAWKERCDLLFCPGYLSPIGSRVPVVVTIHDTQFINIPAHVDYWQALAFRCLVPVGARRARRIIAVSQFSRSRIIEALGIPAWKVKCIYEAPSRRTSSGIANGGDRVLDSLGIQKPYLLAVSGGVPHKNLKRLVTSFETSRPRLRRKMQLVLGGVKASDVGLHLGQSVRCTGFVSDSNLACLFNNACGFLHPSLYEGFGLPVLEAMVSGVPVACSTAGSLPEVAGNGAIYFDPASTASIASAIERLVLDEGLRGRLVREGTANLRRFSWEICAHETLETFNEALGTSVANS